MTKCPYYLLSEGGLCRHPFAGIHIPINTAAIVQRTLMEMLELLIRIRITTPDGSLGRKKGKVI